MIDDEKPDPMYLLTGQAVVEWSRVEMFWAFLFRDLLFDGVGNPVEFDPETRAPLPPKNSAARVARANAVFFNAGSADAQRRLIESVAKVVLADRDEQLSDVTKLLKKSRTLAVKRNKIVHAYYDNPLIWTGGNTLRMGGFEIDDFGGARPKPDFSFHEAVADFRRHANAVRDMWLRVISAA